MTSGNVPVLITLITHNTGNERLRQRVGAHMVRVEQTLSVPVIINVTTIDRFGKFPFLFVVYVHRKVIQCIIYFSVL